MAPPSPPMSRRLDDLKQRIKRFMERLFPPRFPKITLTPATPRASPTPEPMGTSSGLQYVQVGDHCMIVDPTDPEQMRRVKGAKELAEGGEEATGGEGVRPRLAAPSTLMVPEGGKEGRVPSLQLADGEDARAMRR